MQYHVRFVVLGILGTSGALLGALSCQAAAPADLQTQTAAVTSPPFLGFESGQVRPLAMSADGTRLFAVNTPNNTLEIFNVTASGLTFSARVPVGLEPVAVAARNASEVWVVNHLSDSVSVVTLTGTPHVTRTLLVGDEPRDIVFAGSAGRAFITTAHRGQQRTDPSIASVPGAGDPQLTTPSVPRADVWVFDPAQLGTTLGGTPVKIRVAQGGAIKGFLFDPNTSNFVPAGGGTSLSDSALRALAQAAGQEVTFTCVPPGSGARIAATL